MKTEEKAAPPQTEQDHIERLRAMESDHGETWDLSPNDQAAIRWARYQLEINKELLEALEKGANSLEVALQVALAKDIYDSRAEWEAAIQNNGTLKTMRAAIAKARGRQL